VRDLDALRITALRAVQVQCETCELRSPPRGADGKALVAAGMALGLSVRFVCSRRLSRGAWDVVPQATLGAVSACPERSFEILPSKRDEDGAPAIPALALRFIADCAKFLN
jgi:hypothetical protein